MKRAIIYIRVSTDEQANNGYSLGHQKTVLQTYCKLKGFQIVKIYREDHSAKDFNRPEFMKLTQFLKENKKEIDLILFTKWDRFSRNSEEAYRVIREFNAMGVEINAIEQPLDLSVPDSKILLAVYLAIPEVENDKNSQRTTDGMRRANTEGCWTGKAPIGYKNVRTFDGKSTLEKSDKAHFIQRAFAEYAKGIYMAEEVRKMLYCKEFKPVKQSFINILSNRVYVGQIVIKAWKDEPERVVSGLHPALVSEAVFNRVQEIRERGKRNQSKPKKRNVIFPLKGHLLCPECGGNRTASLSTGRGKRYAYYHCNAPCTSRHRMELVNESFVEHLSDIKIRPEVSELYLLIMQDIYRKRTKSQEAEVERIDKELSKLQQRKDSLLYLFADGEVEKRDYDDGIERLTDRINELAVERITVRNADDEYMKYQKFGTHLLMNLDTAYVNAPIEIKQKLIGSIFPEKLVFDGENYRTAKKNMVLELIASNSWDVARPKTELACISASQSIKAPPDVVLSNQFLEDLGRLWELNNQY